MKIKEKSKDLFGKYHFIMAPLLLALMSALGFNEYEKRQEAPSVTVNVESMPAEYPTDSIDKAIREHLANYH